MLAPVYSMGLFHATRKRLATSWGMLIGISAIVAICKRVPQPWRSGNKAHMPGLFSLSLRACVEGLRSSFGLLS